MTTDTAVRVTRLVVQDGRMYYLVPIANIGRCVLMNIVALDKVPYVDFPELKFNAHESTQMPFRYVTDKEGSPIMPQVRNAILCHDREGEKADLSV